MRGGLLCRTRGQLGRTGRCESHQRYLTQALGHLGQTAANQRASGQSKRGGIRRVSVDDRPHPRSSLIHRQMQRHLGCRTACALQHSALHIDQHQISRCQLAFGKPGRCQQYLFFRYTHTDIAIVACHQTGRPEPPPDLAYFGRSRIKAHPHQQNLLSPPLYFGGTAQPAKKPIASTRQ